MGRLGPVKGTCMCFVEQQTSKGVGLVQACKLQGASNQRMEGEWVPLKCNQTCCLQPQNHVHCKQTLPNETVLELDPSTKSS